MILGKDTGNLMSWVRGTGGTPKVGEGATEVMWTDRKAYTVVEVSEDGKRVVIQRDKAIKQFQGMTDSQHYTYEQDEAGIKMELFFKWGHWRQYQPNHVEGKYPRVNMQFGIRDEFYDFSF